MKNFVIVLLGLVSITFAIFGLSNKDQRWLFLNGNMAEEYAKALLKKHNHKMTFFHPE